ncbi:MAG: hypothetical protein P4L74_04285 [Candidatus Doudnabacteria bacterium]|nr:hypothetical protein [Candidatus Doudnabacteria bacterium]
MKKLAVFAFLFILVADAQVKKQVLVGAGGSFPDVGEVSPTVAAGGALIFPLGSKLFFRPAAAFSRNFPQTGKAARQIQALLFVGVKVRPFLAILGGRGETWVFVAGKPDAVLPITTILSAWFPWPHADNWKKRIGFFTPVSHTSTKKGWGAGLQVGYTW